jgi:hypothetical protein
MEVLRLEWKIPRPDQTILRLEWKWKIPRPERTKGWMESRWPKWGFP